MEQSCRRQLIKTLKYQYYKVIRCQPINKISPLAIIQILTANKYNFLQSTNTNIQLRIKQSCTSSTKKYKLPTNNNTQLYVDN